MTFRQKTTYYVVICLKVIIRHNSSVGVHLSLTCLDKLCWVGGQANLSPVATKHRILNMIMSLSIDLCLYGQA